MILEIPVVHCVDTEGPLNESDFDSWCRVKELCSLDYEEDFVKKIIRGHFDNVDNIVSVKNIINETTMNYVRTVDEHALMLDEIFSTKFRKNTTDSYGGHYKFSWFVMDHIDYETDDRDKVIGYHKLYDIFDKRIKEEPAFDDILEFHFHSNAPTKHSSHSNTFWLRDSKIYNIILRRLIDRNFFPMINRPGFHSVSPDSHWFQELFIPFEFANQSLAKNRNERFSDWSRAPRTWEGYHPCHDDYQSIGNSRRKIFSCLNVGTRHSLIDEDSILYAIEEAKQGKKPILAVTNHDFRQMKDDSLFLNDLLNCTFSKEKNIAFKYCNAREALNLNYKSDVFDVVFTGKNDAVMKVTSDQKIFGPVPFFGFKTVDNQYIYDNLKIIKPFLEWEYEFDEQNSDLTKINKIALAANLVGGGQKKNIIDVARNDF